MKNYDRRNAAYDATLMLAGFILLGIFLRLIGVLPL
jgi:hypothetical protein